jgi:hypothetical protein
MNGYRSMTPPHRFQPGAKVKVISTKLANTSIEIGDIGTLKYASTSGGWIIQFTWHWRLEELVELFFDLLFLGWLGRTWFGYWGCGILCSHLFEHQLELMTTEVSL